MMIGESKFGASLLLSLPEDVFVDISRLLSPTDICNLSICCKSLYGLVGSDKIWLVQCEELKSLSLSEIFQWRIGISSYKALCRFLVEVMKPLVGIWLYQNPEIGHAVCVVPGFLSVAVCRIIPQELGDLGIQEGRVVWSPVYEIICGFDGSPRFFLHGRDGRDSCLYPGVVTCIDKSCNVLVLEVEPRREKKLCSDDTEGESSGDFQYSKLAFRDRRYLLDLVTRHVGLHVSEPLIGMLFHTASDDEAMLWERRTMLLKMDKFGVNLEEDAQLGFNLMPRDIKELRGGDMNSQNFLNSSDTLVLSLKASHTEITPYEGWSVMNPEHYALYKPPMKDHAHNQEYAGLWGGTFEWPLGKSTEDEPVKAFSFLMLTYDNSREERLLIGTKVRQSSRSVDPHNGCVMFVVNIDKPSFEPFPFDADGRKFEHSYKGKGIGYDYGSRYPVEPGSLFVISSDFLAFVWQETNKVFTVRRLKFQEILKKGLCVSPLSTTMNISCR